MCGESSSDNRVAAAGDCSYKTCAGSGLFPAVAVPVVCQGKLRCRLSLFRLFLNVRDGFLVMLFRDEHVERWNYEQSEDRSNGHAANQDKTNGISRGRAGTGDESQWEVASDGRDARHHNRPQTNSGGFCDCGQFV
jgi:hypothetical protein